jgi:hypothetical protein
MGTPAPCAKRVSVDVERLQALVQQFKALVANAPDVTHC